MPTITPTSEPPPTTTPLSSYASLPPGQYIVYEDQAIGSELYVLSLDGSFQQRLMDDAIGTLTPNGRQVLVSTDDGLAVLDLEQNTLTSLNPPTDLCGWISGSPDFTTAVMECKGRTIYILSLHDGTKYPLFTSDEPQLEAYYAQPLWSPDGKWISFFYYNVASLSYPERRSKDTGLYLIDTTCLAEPSTCPEKTRGPFQADFWMQRPYSWSPDSQYLVMVTERTGSPFLVFNVENGTFRALEVADGWDDIFPVHWSPDGRWIAYSRRFSSEDGSLDIFIIPADGGMPIHLLDGNNNMIVLNWLTVSFQIGDVLTITEAGANLNLRETPSLDGAVLQKLQPGDTVTILDGPIESDGYTWWYMRTDADGAEGWAVENYGWYKAVEWIKTPEP